MKAYAKTIMIVRAKSSRQESRRSGSVIVDAFVEDMIIALTIARDRPLDNAVIESTSSRTTPSRRGRYARRVAGVNDLRIDFLDAERCVSV